MAVRHTRRRAEILRLLDEITEFRSAQQMHELMRARGSSIGLATVYRAVQSLTETGELDVVRSRDGEALYRRCTRRGHHHHVVCRVCGSAVEIDGPAAEEWAESVASSHGYSDVEHVLELIGTCAVCRAAEDRAAGDPAEAR